MTDGGESGQMADKGIFAGEAFGQESPEPAGSIAVVIAVEVIPAHLVHDDADDQFGAGQG